MCNGLFKGCQDALRFLIQAGPPLCEFFLDKRPIVSHEPRAIVWLENVHAARRVWIYRPLELFELFWSKSLRDLIDMAKKRRAAAASVRADAIQQNYMRRSR